MIFCYGTDGENCFDFSPVGIYELLTKPRHINVPVFFLLSHYASAGPGLLDGARNKC